MTATRYDILPAAQRALLPELAPLKRAGFVLYGGTAIALRLGHRISIDFDFFTDRPMDRVGLRRILPLLEDAQILLDEPRSLTIRIAARGHAGVKVSFFAELGFGRIGHPTTTDNDELALASLDDLLGHKLKVILQRAETKDYRDIASMLRAGLVLERGLGAAMTLFPGLPPAEVTRALVYFTDPELADLPRADCETLITRVSALRTPMTMPRASDRLAD